ncbi:hypothetical protein FRC11_014641, partial [Ceratobasidium sp. 423]
MIYRTALVLALGLHSTFHIARRWVVRVRSDTILPVAVNQELQALSTFSRVMVAVPLPMPPLVDLALPLALDLQLTSLWTLMAAGTAKVHAPLLISSGLSETRLLAAYARPSMLQFLVVVIALDPVLTLPRRPRLESFTSSHKKALLPLILLGPPLKSSSSSLRPLVLALGPALPLLARRLSKSEQSPCILLAPDVPASAPLFASFKSMFVSALVHARDPHDPHPALIRRLALFRLKVAAPRIDPAGLILRDLRELFMWAARPSHVLTALHVLALLLQRVQGPAGRAAAPPGPVLLMLADLSGVEHDHGRSRSLTRIVRVGSSRSRSHSPPRVIHVHGSSTTAATVPVLRDTIHTKFMSWDQEVRGHAPLHALRRELYTIIVATVVAARLTCARPVLGLALLQRSFAWALPIGTNPEAPMVVTPHRKSVVVLPSSEWVPVVPFSKGRCSSHYFSESARAAPGGSSGRYQTPTPQVSRVTSPQAQIPNVIRVGGTPQPEEPSCIIRVGVPRTTLPSYLPTDVDKQPGEPARRYLSHISEESAVSGASETPPVIEILEPQPQRPPVHRTASGRTEAPPPQVIRIGAGSRAGRSDVPAEQIRVTTPGPIEYPYPPQVIHIGTGPSEDYPPQIVRVHPTKPVPQPEAPLTIVRIPTAQGRPEYQTHVIRVASPPAVVAPSAPHVVRLGTPSHAQEEPQWIRVKSPPHQIINPVPPVVHLKSAPQAPVGPQIIRVATAIPQLDPAPAPAQVFRIGTPAYPEPPQVVHVGTAKPTLPDKLEQIIRIGTPSYPKRPQTSQVICVCVQTPKEAAEPQVIRIGTPGGVPPAPQVIRVAAPHKEVPPPMEVVRIGSPTMTAPTEPQVIRVTSPPAQPQEPVRVVRVGSAAPRDFDPQVIRVKSPERPPAPTEIIRVGSIAPTSSEGPQVIRVGTSYPAPEPTQVIRTGTTHPVKVP